MTAPVPRIISWSSWIAFCVVALTCHPVAWAQLPGVELPSGAEPDVRLEQVTPPRRFAPPPVLEVPGTAPSRVPAGAETARFVLTGLEVSGVSVYGAEAVRALYEETIGTEVTLAFIYQVAEQLQRRYRDDGYFLTRVIVPPQEISAGRPKIRVLEGYVSDLRFEGEIGDVRSKVESYLEHVLQDRPIRLETLERYLLLANDLPGVELLAVLRPSPGEVGAAELVLNVAKKSFDGVAILDNVGSSFNGEWELAASASANAFTSAAERVTFTGLVSSEPSVGPEENQKVVQLSVRFHPGDNGAYAGASASYGDSNPGGEIEALDFNSTKLLISAVGGYPFIRSRNFNLSGELGFDFSDSDADIFGDVRFTRDRLRVLHLTGRIDLRDSWRGSSFAELELRQGLPILDASESGDDFLSRADGTGVFTLIKGTASRLQPLVDDFSIYGTVSGQVAFDDLLSDEEFDVGGLRFGRGYDPKEISGDHGIGLTAELQYSRQTDLEFLERLQLFAFYDFGAVWDRGTGVSQSLSSFGAGLRVWPLPWISLELLGAKPLTRDSQRAGGSRDPQVLFRAYGRF